LTGFAKSTSAQALCTLFGSVALGCVLVCSPANAETLSIRRAVSAALTQNPEVAVALAQEQASTAERESAEWGRFPRLSMDYQTATATGVAGGSTSLRLDQPLWAGGRIDGAIKAAGAQELAQQEAVRQVRQDISERTASAYVSLVESVERQKLARKSAETFDSLAAYVERRFVAGVASKSDVTLATVRRLQIQVLQQQLDVETAQVTAQLQSLTLREITGTVALKVRSLDGSSLEEAERVLVNQSPLIKQRLAQIDAAKAQVAQRSAALWPTVSLRVEEIRYSAARDSRVGVVMQYAPDAGLATLSQMKAAQALVQAAEDRLKGEQVLARLRARSLKETYLSARAQSEQIAQQLSGLELNVDSFLRQFEVGRKTWVEVLSIHRELVDARINLSRTREQHDQSALRLMAAAGTLDVWLDGLPQ